ncbi:MAG: galactokinase [Isosphaerales bacterium]
MCASFVSLLAQAYAAFTDQFGGEPAVLACAPGRVELLGNHTDYNGGLVMAAAIDRSTIVVGRRASGRHARVFSVNFGQTDTYPLDAIEPSEAGAWTRYVRGVCWALTAWSGPLASGFEAAIVGDVPLGAGLSSSASLQASVAWFLIQLGLIPGRSSRDFQGDQSDSLRMELAQALRRSENDFVGVGSGLLDQFSSLFGRAGFALFLDCTTLIHDRLPLGSPAPAIVVCDSQTSRRLADGMYNQRRAECERVLAALRDKIPHRGEFRLSQVPRAELETEWEHLDPIGRRRARHVLSENDRVRQGVEALKSHDITAFGRLMSASHASSRDDFENSSFALDALIEFAGTAPGFLGGKLSGAGWAGCTVNLVRAEFAGDFAEAVRTAYARRTGTTPEIHICHAAEGAFGRDLVPPGP